MQWRVQTIVMGLGASVVVLSIFFAFDPDVNFPGSEKVPWPVKLLLFFLGVALVLKLYSYTKDFRSENKKMGAKA